MASVTDRPDTSGTATSSGPFDTRTSTALSRGTCVSRRRCGADDLAGRHGVAEHLDLLAAELDRGEGGARVGRGRARRRWPGPRGAAGRRTRRGRSAVPVSTSGGVPSARPITASTRDRLVEGAAARRRRRSPASTRRALAWSNGSPTRSVGTPRSCWPSDTVSTHDLALVELDVGQRVLGEDLARRAAVGSALEDLVVPAVLVDQLDGGGAVHADELGHGVARHGDGLPRQEPADGEGGEQETARSTRGHRRRRRLVGPRRARAR